MFKVVLHTTAEDPVSLTSLHSKTTAYTHLS